MKVIFIKDKMGFKKGDIADLVSFPLSVALKLGFAEEYVEPKNKQPKKSEG